MPFTGLNPIGNPEAWDRLIVDGEEAPGIVVAWSGWKRETEWDIKKGKGSKGATTTVQSLPPAQGSFTFQVYTEQQFILWDHYRERFKYDPTKKKTSAVDVFHPALAQIDVKSVVTKSLGAMERKSGGLYECTIEMIEYLPPSKKSATSTPSGSTSKGTKNPSGAAADPIADAQQKEIAKLLQEAGKP